MPSLEDILNDDLGLGAEHVKTAGASAPESDEIEKLAMEIGLVPDDTMSSASTNETTGQTKEAQMGLENLYEELFPGDAVVAGGSEKTAAEDKTAAAIEESMGELAFDAYHSGLQSHIEKFAEAFKEAESATSVEAADGTPAQTMASNEDKSKGAIDTKPQVQDQLMGTHPEGTVGKFENPAHPNGEMRKQASRKALLLSLIDKE